MKKNIVALGIFVVSLLHSQTISSGKWNDLFSYNNVLVIREDNGRLMVVTENGIFYYDTISGEVSKLSKANGLHEVKISAFDYNPETKTALVGYTSGRMDLITENEITYVVDIPMSNSFSGSRAINHIYINGNQAVVSADYGVSIYNLDTKGFGDTAFLTESVREAIIKDNTVFAITTSGIKSHTISTTFPLPSTWKTVISGAFTNISTDGNWVSYSTNNKVYYGNSTALTSFGEISLSADDVKDLIINDEEIIVAYQSGKNYKVEAYKNGTKTQDKSTDKNLNTAWVSSGEVYLGSEKNGVLKYADNGTLNAFKPDGPYSNKSYKINLLRDKIWVAGGTRDDYNTVSTSTPSLGFYFYNGSKWIYPSFFDSDEYKNLKFNILDAIGNPSDYKETYFANYNTNAGQGIYKVLYDEQNQDFEVKKYYSEGQSNAAYNRPVGFAFDDNNNLFATSAYYYKNGKVHPSYVVYSSVKDQFVYRNVETTIEIGAVQMPIHRDGVLYLALPRNPYYAIVNLNNTPENLTDDTVHILTERNGLISGYGGNTVSSSIDKNGHIWLGERYGLRVTNSVSSGYDDLQAEAIVITENGIGEELFRDSHILQIETDSGNQKWVSVEGGGVYYLSSDGQKTIYHFTDANSPLPNNNVTDIKVDERTGKVYFVTNEGIVTYQGDVQNVTANFGNVLVYPNPVVYANYKGSVKIKGLAERTNIRITDASGNLVHQAVARGGYYEWDLTNRGKRVASGVYFVLMTNENGTDKATAKIAVVN